MSNNVTITVLYFASLAEIVQRDEEVLTVDSGDLIKIYQYLSDRYGFTLSQDELAVAINHHIADWHTPANDGDVIAFIPPVAGG